MKLKSRGLLSMLIHFQPGWEFLFFLLPLLKEEILTVFYLLPWDPAGLCLSRSPMTIISRRHLKVLRRQWAHPVTGIFSHYRALVRILCSLIQQELLHTRSNCVTGCQSARLLQRTGIISPERLQLQQSARETGKKLMIWTVCSPGFFPESLSSVPYFFFCSCLSLS